VKDPMQNDYFINVLSDSAFGDLAAGLLLGMEQPDAAVRERVEHFRQRCAPDSLPRPGEQSVDTARALTELVGPDALAQAAFANDWRLVLEKAPGESARLRGQRHMARRHQTPPLEVLEMEIADVSLLSPVRRSDVRRAGRARRAQIRILDEYDEGTTA
jgi:hypothetical protein